MKKKKNETKAKAVREPDWDDINFILESASTVHMGDLSRERHNKVYFLLAETENFALMDRLREEELSFSGYLKRKYPLLSSTSRSALAERARFMDR